MLKKKLKKLNNFVSARTSECLYAVLVLSLALSVGYAFYHRITPAVDARAYDAIALNILSGQGFLEISGQNPQFDPAIIRAGPGYEYFLAGLYRIFGHHYSYVWLFQAILHAATAWLVYLICRQIFDRGGKKIGLLAAALVGFSPDLIEISAMLMTETLYIFLLTLTLYVFVHLTQLRSGYRPVSAGLGVLTGVSILNRPTAGLFALIISFYFGLEKKYKSLLLFLILLFLTLLPWAVRNYRIYRQIIPTTLIGEYNLWLNNTLTSRGGQFSDEKYNPLNEYAKTYGYSALPAKANSEFKNFLSEHPLSFLKLSLLRTVRYFSLIRPMGFWFYQSGWPQAIFVVSSAFYIAVLFVIGFSGMWLSLKSPNRLLFYLTAFAATSPLTLIPVVVQSRYRFQIYPMLAIFGGYLFYRGWNNWVGIKKVLKYTTVILLSVSALDLFLFAGRAADRIKSLI